MKPWPNMVEALAAWQMMRAAGVSRLDQLKHMRAHYPRLADITTWKGVEYVMQQTAMELELTNRLPEVPPASLHYHEEVPELRLPFEPHLAVLSDAHASAHDSRGVALFLKTVEALRIPAVVVNGDLFDNAYLGHGGVRDARAASAAENIFCGASILNAIVRSGAERIYVVQGNHDDKPLRSTDGEILFPQWWASQVAPHLGRPELFTVTHRYYCIMDAMDPQPEGTRPRHFPTRFTHQREYGRPPLAVASRLADKFLMNVVTGHQHHLGFSRHKSGKLMIADAGTIQHRDGAQYKVNRDSTHPEWCAGFLTLHWGEPRVWALDSPNEWWAHNLGIGHAELG